jgi:DNA-binding HxlR family transcriptional regulator
LTDKGKKLASVIRAIADWGESSIPKSRGQRRSSSTQA